MPKEVKWAISILVGIGLVYAGWHFIPLLLTLHILVCFLLVVVIMLQSGSAADLAGAFGGAGSQTAFGPRGAATFLSRATTWCAVVFMLTSLALWLKRSPEGFSLGGSSIFQQTKAPAPAKPNMPVHIPAQAPPPDRNAAPAQSAPSQTPPAQKAPAPR